MDAVKYLFRDHVKTQGSQYIFQSITKQKLSNIYHSHDFFELFLLLHGTATHQVNGVAPLMQEGDCVILTPRDAHSFVDQSEDLELVALSVQCDEFLALADVYRIDLRSGGASPFSCSERLGELKNQANRCCHAIGDNENKLLLFMLLNLYAAAQKAEQPSLLANAVSMMRTQENIKAGLPALVALTNYSYPHLYRLIRQHYGTTPHALILKLKLDAAYSRLIHSDSTVEQIAEDVGFSSVSHFIKTFKTQFGISPAKLREQKRSTCF